MKNYAIIAAGGNASRLNIEGGKQLMQLAGRPVFIRSVEYFQSHPLIHEIIIVIQSSDVDIAKELVRKFNLTKVSCVVASGKTRQDSVYNGFSQIKEDGCVLVHDGARPLMKSEYISNIIDYLADYDGAIIGVPVVDTIKQVGDDKIITATPKRSTLYAAQTPQGFRVEILRKAFQNRGEASFTDDASMVEYIGGKVRIIEGDTENLKITHPKDIPLAEQILKSRTESPQPPFARGR